MRWKVFGFATATIGMLLLGGCAGYKPDQQVMKLTKECRFGEARERIDKQSPPSPKDRDFTLHRMRRLAEGVADGCVQSSEPDADRVYDFLRTQGVNADKTIATFFVGEGNARIYKGEPYEQAVAYTLIAASDAMQGEWGNAYASAQNSLFLLRDFSDAMRERTKNDKPAAENGTATQSEADRQLAEREALLRASAEAEQERKNAKDSKNDQAAKDQTQDDALGVDYRAVASDFEVGYLLRAVAARQSGQRENAVEAINILRQVAPHLAGLGDEVVSGKYDTVLLVAYGLAPRKSQAGMDGVYAVYPPHTPSDQRVLRVRAGTNERAFPVATDVNRLAEDVKWNNLEDLRVAKSYVGTGLLAAGAATTAVGAGNSNEAVIAGLAMMAAGALLKSSAGADTRHVEVFPQRFYVALLNAPQDGRVQLEIDGDATTRLTLTGLSPSRKGGQFRYVVLPMTQGVGTWANSGQVLYANDVQPKLANGPTLPYILGGRCVATPTPDRMSDYYAAGLPRDVTLDQIVEMYNAEGIVIADMDPALPGKHLLEGGKWLYTPVGGTTGYARIYGQEHPAYQPTSSLVNELRLRLTSGAPSTVSERSAPTHNGATQIHDLADAKGITPCSSSALSAR